MGQYTHDPWLQRLYTNSRVEENRKNDLHTVGANLGKKFLVPKLLINNLPQTHPLDYQLFVSWFEKRGHFGPNLNFEILKCSEIIVMQTGVKIVQLMIQA